MKKVFSLLAGIFALGAINASAQIKETPLPELVQENGHFSLIVDGSPYLILGGQCGNSSNWPATLDGVWHTMKEMNANTLEIPVYWEEIERVRGQYDFTSVQRLLDQAREQDLRLILLWFATWKNGSNHYMPEWMKLDSKTFYNVTSKDGRPIDSPSPHVSEAMDLDAKAFAALMRYLKENDPCHTVIMVQVENEPGTWDSVRDYGKTAEKLFNKDVPAALMKPEILKELGADPKAKRGSWSEVFGERADEYFHAWSVASYINNVAEAGQKVNPLPMYVNAALRDPITNPMADQYESGGPTDNVICIYKAAAPAICLCAPDIYQSGDEKYTASIKLYDRKDNALMVPESSNVNLYLYEVLSRGLGFAPFGVDGRVNAQTPISLDYAILAPAASQIAKWRTEGRLFSAFENESHDSEEIDLGSWKALLTFSPGHRGTAPAKGTKGIPSVGKVMMVKLAEDEFYAFGNNVHFTFEPLGKNVGKAWHYLVVEEGHFEEGEFVRDRILNGDQTDWGGPTISSQPQVLHIKLYSRTPIK